MSWPALSQIPCSPAASREKLSISRVRLQCRERRPCRAHIPGTRTPGGSATCRFRSANACRCAFRASTTKILRPPVPDDQQEAARDRNSQSASSGGVGEKKSELFCEIHAANHRFLQVAVDPLALERCSQPHSSSLQQGPPPDVPISHEIKFLLWSSPGQFRQRLLSGNGVAETWWSPSGTTLRFVTDVRSLNPGQHFLVGCIQRISEEARKIRGGTALPSTHCNSGAVLSFLVGLFELRISCQCAPRLPRSTRNEGAHGVLSFSAIHKRERSQVVHAERGALGPTGFCTPPWRSSARLCPRLRVALILSAASRNHTSSHTHEISDPAHPEGKMLTCRTKDLGGQQLCNGCSCDTHISTEGQKQLASVGCLNRLVTG